MVAKTMLNQIAGWQKMRPLGKNILIVDDINDTGATFNWLVDDWEKSGPPGDWSNVWNNNIKFAVLTDNLGSEFTKEIDFR